MLALADYGNDERICWPSVKSLAAKIRLSERQTQTLLRKLEANGDITTHKQAGRYDTNVYEIAPIRGEEECAPAVARGEAQRTQGVKPVAPKPSMEPSSGSIDVSDETSMSQPDPPKPASVSQKDPPPKVPPKGSPPIPWPPPHPGAMAYYVEQFHRKRWRTKQEYESWCSLEEEVGQQALMTAVKWACENGISKLASIRGYARKIVEKKKDVPTSSEHAAFALRLQAMGLM